MTQSIEETAERWADLSEAGREWVLSEFAMKLSCFSDKPLNEEYGQTLGASLILARWRAEQFFSRLSDPAL